MKIEMTVFSGNLVAGWQGIDEMASARRYMGRLSQRILDRWPGVQLNVGVRHAEGVRPATRVWVDVGNDFMGRDFADAEAADAIADEVEAMGETLWIAPWEWVVEDGGLPYRREETGDDDDTAAPV